MYRQPVTMTRLDLFCCPTAIGVQRSGKSKGGVSHALAQSLHHHQFIIHHNRTTQDLLDPGQYKVVPEELYDGVLQKFVEPREAQDHIIRAMWTPVACIFEKRMNT